MSLEFTTILFLGKYQGGSGSGGGGSTPTEIALLSVTTAPASPFAVGSKYYNSSTKKIVTAVTADTWTGATSADPAFSVIYTFNSLYYTWDGNSLEETDLNLKEDVENKSDSYTESSSTTYASTKALVDGLNEKVDKETGKGLSTNDFTDNLETKLIGIEPLAEVITVSSATPSFTSSDKLKVNANYQCGTITSLTFDTSSVDDSQLETTIRFTAGASFAFSYTNAGVKINGELPTFEEDGEYIILIVNKTIFVSDKIVAGV